MKKKTNIKLFGLLGLFLGALTLSSCVANFCSDLDKANIAYPYEQGVTVYVDKKESVPTEYQKEGLSFQPFKSEGNEDLWAYIPVTADGGFGAKKASYLNDNIIASAKKSGYAIPSFEYFKELDTKVLKAAIAEANANGSQYSLKTITAEQINPFNVADCVGNEENVTVNEDSVLRSYGYVKFVSEKNEGDVTSFSFDFGNWYKWNSEIEEDIGASNCPGSDFELIYKNSIESTVNNIRSCITTREGKYGHYGTSGNWTVSMETTSWGDAWGKGLFEGLIVYPVAWLVDTLSLAMDPALSGVGQIWALIITTLIVRVILLALTFKSTSDQQKMQAIQPQLAKIQQKYPNSATNQAEKMRLSQEQMALYKRNGISMFSTFIGLIIQFPVFISVWGALQGSAVLASGEVLNLRLSDTIQSVLFNTSGTWYLNTSGWWTALVLFVLMSVLQFLAMKLPQWITKAKTKKQAHLTANPTADKNAKTMKYVSYGMLIFTIFLGFALPAAMGVYWAIGALLSMLQTIVVQTIMSKKMAKKMKKY
ncbi:MAG TPA: hypothetical protein DCZ41_01260 [Firmicutes bacterium]|nr:hypothetical protein [Bacillota bacterium]